MPVGRYPPPPGAANGRGSTRPSSHVSAGHRPADTATRRAAELLPGPVRQLAAARSVIFASGGRRRRGGRKQFVQASPSLHSMGRPRPTQGKQTRNPFSYEDNLHPNRSKRVDVEDIDVYLTSVACCSLASYDHALNCMQNNCLRSVMQDQATGETVPRLLDSHAHACDEAHIKRRGTVRQY